MGVAVRGHLNLEAASLSAPLIAHGCFFEKPVNLAAATAPELTFSHCFMPGLAADRLEVQGALDLSGTKAGLVALVGAHVRGALFLRGTHITGGSYPLDLAGGTLHPKETRAPGTLKNVALVADRLRVDHSLIAREQFVAQGQVRLAGADIGGVLILHGARLTSEDTSALWADGLRVGLGMHCPRLVATGGVSLVGAHVCGDLLLNRAELSGGQGRPALSGHGLKVDRSLLCHDHFTARGEVVLSGADVGAELNLAGAELSAPDQSAAGEEPIALKGERLTVGGDVLCTPHEGRSFEATGAISLYGAQVSGSLDFDEASLATSGDYALVLRRARVNGELRLALAKTPTGGVDLAAARIGELRDREETWPRRFRLRGLVYDHLHAQEDPHERRDQSSRKRRSSTKLPSSAVGLLWPRVGADVNRRLRWVKRAEREEGYAPQPYTQLSELYRRQGRDRDARRVAFERERQRRSKLTGPAWVWNFFLEWTVGYGYRPWLAALYLVVLVPIGALVLFESQADVIQVRTGASPFESWIFTLDLLVPVVNLRQRDAWTPGPAVQWWAFAYTLAGWALTTAVVAGLTAAVRRP